MHCGRHHEGRERNANRGGQRQIPKPPEKKKIGFLSLVAELADRYECM